MRVNVTFNVCLDYEMSFVHFVPIVLECKLFCRGIRATTTVDLVMDRAGSSRNSKRTEQNGTFNSGSSITSQGIFRIYNQNKRRKSGEKSLQNCPKKFLNVTIERE